MTDTGPSYTSMKNGAMKATGKATRNTARVLKNCAMAQNSKGIINTAKEAVTANKLLPTEAYTRATLNLAKFRAKVSISGAMGKPTLASGKRASYTAKEFSTGPMGESMRVNTLNITNTGKENIPGQMENHTAGVGSIISNMVRGYLLIKMESRKVGCGKMGKDCVG